MADLVGHVLGAYRLEALLGNGATGAVYRASGIGGEPCAAVKVLHASLAANPGFAARFCSVLETVSALRHPHVIEIYQFGVQDGLCFVATELVSVGSLKTYLRGRLPGEPAPPALAADFIAQAALGLDYAHEHGIVHKDVKPSNLLLDRRAPIGDEGAGAYSAYTVKLADLGLAQLAASASALTTVGAMLGTGVMLGSPAYMPPEQCRGQALDERSDVYALGIVLYELVTGYLPFQVSSLQDAARAHLYSPPPLPRLLNPAIPQTLERVVLRCLAKMPEDRYDSAAAVSRALLTACPT